MGLLGTISEVNEFTATVPTPAVGTDILAADVIAGLQAVTNRTLYLNTHKLISISNSYQTFPASLGSWTTTSFVQLSGMEIVLTDCEIGDILAVQMSMSVSMNGTSDAGAVIGLFADDNGGGDQALFGAEALIPRREAADSPSIVPFAITSLWVVTDTGTTEVKIKGKVADADDDCTSGTYSMVVHRYRGY